MAKNRSRPFNPWLLAFFVFFSIAPDLDVLPGILVGDARAFHRDPSHSFLFGLLFTLPVVVIVKRYLRWFPDQGFISLTLSAYLMFVSHIVLDLITLDNGFPYGMPLMWPISNAHFSAPFYIIPNVLHGGSALSSHNFNVVLRELVVFSPLALYFALANRGLLGNKYRAGSFAVMAVTGLILFILAQSNPYF